MRNFGNIRIHAQKTSLAAFGFIFEDNGCFTCSTLRVCYLAVVDRDTDTSFACVLGIHLDQTRERILDDCRRFGLGSRSFGRLGGRRCCDILAGGFG